jgi:hypothetical protein
MSTFVLWIDIYLLIQITYRCFEFGRGGGLARIARTAASWRVAGFFQLLSFSSCREEYSGFI